MVVRRRCRVKAHQCVVGKRLAVVVVVMHVVLLLLLLPGVTGRSTGGGQDTAIIGIGIVTMR